MFNQEQTLSLVRTLLQIIGASVVTNGYMTGGQWEALVGAVLTIGVTVWGIWVRRNTGLVEAAAAVPEVQKIVTDPVTAVKTVSAKIVARNL